MVNSTVTVCCAVLQCWFDDGGAVIDYRATYTIRYDATNAALGDVVPNSRRTVVVSPQRG